MGIITLFLVNASIFSINGLGEDLSVFRTPFVDYLRMAQVKFILQPELTILGENGDYRGVFWTNPFQISLSVPLGKGFFLTFANTERFGQSFDRSGRDPGFLLVR
jgi:hypothetical protein